MQNENSAAAPFSGVTLNGNIYGCLLCLVLPYATAEYLNNRKSFERYYDRIEISDESANAHPKAAMQIRNRGMVDRADLVICCIEHESGGAFQTVRYARKREKRICNLLDEPSLSKNIQQDDFIEKV